MLWWIRVSGWHMQCNSAEDTRYITPSPNDWRGTATTVERLESCLTKTDVIFLGVAGSLSRFSMVLLDRLYGKVCQSSDKRPNLEAGVEGWFDRFVSHQSVLFAAMANRMNFLQGKPVRKVPPANASHSRSSSTPQVNGTSATIYGGGVKDPSGRITEYSVIALITCSSTVFTSETVRRRPVPCVQVRQVSRKETPIARQLLLSQNVRLPYFHG